MEPYAGADYNLILCPLQSWLQHIYDGQPVPESTLTLCQSRLWPPFRDFGFGLWTQSCVLYVSNDLKLKAVEAKTIEKIFIWPTRIFVDQNRGFLKWYLYTIEKHTCQPF